MLAIAGGKGGCGKTTTAVGIARTLARRGYDPLVLDADCDMPDVHHVAGVGRTGEDDRSGVARVADGAPVRRATSTSPTLPDVRLLTAGTGQETERALRTMNEWHGPVLVDCPAGVAPDATRPLRHAETTLVVSTDEPQCLEDAAKTRRVAEKLGSPSIGVLLRRRGGDLDNESAIATVPSVEEPFRSQQVEAGWHAVVDELDASGWLSNTGEWLFDGCAQLTTDYTPNMPLDSKYKN